MVVSRTRLRALYYSILGGEISFGAGSKVESQALLSARKGGSIRIGRRTTVGRRAMLLAEGGPIVLGDDCTVNPYSVLYGHGGLTIGNWVRIAAHVVIVPSNHRFGDLSRPIAKQGLDQIGVTIEDDVWIGAHVTVLDGAHIAKGCVIAAGAVVRGRTEPYGVYAGVPARMIKRRG